MIPHIKLMTVAEFEAFEALPENRDRLLELIHGEIVEKMPTELHGFAAAKISRFTDEWVENNDIEGFVGVEVRHRMPSDDYNSRLPDVSFRYATTIVAKGAVAQMPDFAVEIQSPDDTLEDLRDRIEYYLRNGTRLGWIILTLNPSVEVCKLENDTLKIVTYGIDEMLDGGDVLPGFTLPVKKLFPKQK
jgi:Uma2 family endonuclease